MRRKTLVNLNHFASISSMGRIRPNLDDIHLVLLKKGFDNFPEAERVRESMSKSFRRCSINPGLEEMLTGIVEGFSPESPVIIKKIDKAGIFLTIDIFE